MTGVKALLVLPVAALDLPVVARRIGTDKLVSDTELCSGGLKQGGKIPLAVGKAVGELKPVVSLNALYPDAPAGIPADQLVQEVGGGVGGLFRVGSQEAQAGELVNGGILEQAKFRVCHTLARHHLHIYLDPLAGIGHLLVRLGLANFFLLLLRKQPQFAQNAEQTLRAAGVAPFSKPVP